MKGMKNSLYFHFPPSFPQDKMTNKAKDFGSVLFQKV